MKRSITITVITSALLFASTGVSGQDRKRRVDAFIREEMAKQHIPGAAVAVLRNGKVELMDGYGLANVELKIPVTPHSMFQIASTTKPFTAMAILILTEDGKLSLEDKAAKYLPWLPAVYSEVTVRQLLTHTSGVNRDVRTENVDNFTLDEFKKRLAVASVSFKPGEKWEYANTGYILLGMIIEAVSGKSYGEFLRQRIFKPLGMKNSSYNETPDKAKNRALGYDWVGNNYQPSPYFHGGYGAGALISSAADLAKWEQALDAKKILKQSSYDLMWTSVRLKDGKPFTFDWRGEQSGYGFGWFLAGYKGHKVFTHGGVLSGFSSVINRFVDDKLTVIVLANSKAGAVRLGHAEILANGIADLYFSDSTK